MTPLPRFARSLRLAWQGVRSTVASQPHFRFELLVAGFAVTLALLLNTGVVAVVLASTLVLSAELLNTAVEATVDLLSPESHPLAARAKDAAAGAVLVASGGALLVGVVVFGPALWGILQGGWR